jgi:hypothetical protein
VLVKKSNLPGPGSYEMKEIKKVFHSRSSSRAERPKSLSRNSSTGNLPGPGEYNADSKFNS